MQLSLIREYLEAGDIQNLEWIDTSRQVADELTKNKSLVLLTRYLNFQNSTMIIDCGHLIYYVWHYAFGLLYHGIRVICFH